MRNYKACGRQPDQVALVGKAAAEISNWRSKRPRHENLTGLLFWNTHLGTCCPQTKEVSLGSRFESQAPDVLRVGDVAGPYIAKPVLHAHPGVSAQYLKTLAIEKWRPLLLSQRPYTYELDSA